MHLVLPKEHGTWSMFLLPALLGIVFSEFNSIQVPFILGWFFVFLASTPFLNIYRNRKKMKIMMPWLIAYVLIAVIFLLPIFYVHPTLMVICSSVLPFLSVNLIFIKIKKERHILNDLSGIMIFCIGGVAVFYLGHGQILSNKGFMMFAIPFLYFFGATLYVKTLIRERKNKRYLWMSHIYHLILILFPIIFGWMSLFFIFIPNLIKDWLTPRKKPLKPIVIGVTEIINAAIFLVLCVVGTSIK